MLVFSTQIYVVGHERVKWRVYFLKVFVLKEVFTLAGRNTSVVCHEKDIIDDQSKNYVKK